MSTALNREINAHTNTLREGFEILRNHITGIRPVDPVLAASLVDSLETSHIAALENVRAAGELSMTIELNLRALNDRLDA